MSSGVVELQAEVESVLGALLKAATAELTRLFESRYRASGLDVEAGRAANKEGNETSEPPDTVSTGDTTRSIGVQVDEHLYPPELCGPGLLSDGDCLRGFREKEQERCLIPSEILLTEDNGHVDPERSPLNQQVVTQTEDLAELMTVDMVEFSRFEAELPASGDLQTEVSLHQKEKDHDRSVKETSSHKSLKSSPNKQKLLVIQPDTCGLSSGEKVKFVCPLILKPESPAPKPDGSEKPVQAEPQSACVSTAKGKAYSPSPSDGAVTPAQAGVWERIHTPKESKNNLHIKLKLMSPDQKLMSACAVQLVNMLTVPEWEMKLQDKHANSHDATHKNGPPLPKDLHRHQGLHTGHRLCCFTPCGDGVWRLQKVVTHSSSGYTCSICGKTFKRRKILRRHERFHTGEKPYSCSTCSKMFALRKSLRRHLRFHTGERPHTCTQCSKSFRLRDNLKAHLRFHTGEKPFSCPTCGKMFRIMRNLEKHKCEIFVPSFRTIAGW